jgi:predicted alpha/beta superfamily hydrolase
MGKPPKAKRTKGKGTAESTPSKWTMDSSGAKQKGELSDTARARLNTFTSAVEGSSPAIWWNNRSLLEKVPPFVAKIRAKEAGPRVLITVGSTEQDVPRPLPPSLTDAVKKKLSKMPAVLRNIIGRMAAKRMMRSWRMVDNARDLSEALQQIGGTGDYAVRFHEFQEEDHLTALPASVGHALAFVLKR